MNWTDGKTYSRLRKVPIFCKGRKHFPSYMNDGYYFNYLQLENVLSLWKSKILINQSITLILSNWLPQFLVLIRRPVRTQRVWTTDKIITMAHRDNYTPSTTCNPKEKMAQYEATKPTLGSFGRIYGPAADMRELEYISALYQNAELFMRSDGTISCRFLLLLRFWMG